MYSNGVVVIFFKGSYLFDIHTDLLTGEIWCVRFALKYSTKPKCGAGEMAGKTTLAPEAWQQTPGDSFYYTVAWWT